MVTAAPRVLIAAPTSGAGKTTVACGLMAALRRCGLGVAGFKVGPDYIDPSWHQVACGRPSRNLDPILQGTDRVAGVLRHGVETGAPVDVAVVEGAMGLFDGALGRQGAGSAAHVAALTGTPVVLVVDASKAARSVAAVAWGCASFDDRVRVTGVILNRVRSARHEQDIRDGLDTVGLPVLGVIPPHEKCAVGSRHLGLLTPPDAPDAAASVAAMADVVADHVDLAAVLACARTAPPLTEAAWCPAEVLPAASVRSPRTVAVFGGPAFTFHYLEHYDLLTAAGLTVHLVDPTTDPALPTDTAALVLGGGFPEVHAQALSANSSFRRDVADAVRDGIPTLAECGGFAYLCRSLDGAPMAGVIPAEATMSQRLLMGYRQARSVGETALVAAGATVMGHEFHRTRVLPGHGGDAAGFGAAWSWGDRDGHGVFDGFAHKTLHATYLHHHWVGLGSQIQRFVAAASQGGQE